MTNKRTRTTNALNKTTEILQTESSQKLQHVDTLRITISNELTRDAVPGQLTAPAMKWLASGNSLQGYGIKVTQHGREMMMMISIIMTVTIVIFITVAHSAH